MIYGIGIDLVDIPRMDRVVRKWGDRFLRRVFTEEESSICFNRMRPASGLALRFAAKEAFSKAMGVGMKRGLKWRDIEVFHHPGGRPDLRLHGTASKMCRRLDISRVHLSLSDEGDYGMAFVVLEQHQQNQ